MRETTFTELRKHAKTFFDVVEAGETVRVYRKGKPIADIVPLPSVMPSWKKNHPRRLTIKGVSLTEEILTDRSAADA